ncbi:von Willebrand factor-like, partial [Paramuricea clavata]
MEDDDFWASNGTIVTNPVEFGNSWKVDPDCDDAIEVPHPCDANSDRRWIAQANCSTLLRPPFNECSSHINATEEGYIADCEYDMCACEDDPVVCYCQALEAYADDCASFVDIPWENLEEFAVCGTPCASAPCYNGGSCTNVGDSFECRCPSRFLGDRCEIEDRCQIPYLFLSTSSNIQSYNVEEPSDGSTIIDSRGNALLYFDGVNKRLYLLHTINNEITSYNLDGSNSATIAIVNVEFFAVDGRNNVIYFHHALNDRIHMHDITNGQTNSVAALSDVDSVKDLDMDMTSGRGNALLYFDGVNKRLYLLHTINNEITSYNLDGSNSATIAIVNVEFFAVDGRNNVIYFHHALNDRIHMHDITNGQTNSVAALSDVDSVKDLDMDMTSGYLYIARSANPPIIRFNPQDGSTMEFSYAGSALSISVDEYNNVIYWTNYIGNTNTHEIMKTSYSGVTTQLNITYSEPLELSNNVLNLYVLDKDSMHVDIYLKTSLEHLGNITLSNTIGDIVIGHDVDECCVGTYCHLNSTCSNSLGSFNCSCNDGLCGNGTHCDDVDECLDDPCHQNATCHDTFGSFDCDCNEGFVGDGFNCEATNCTILSCGENEMCVQEDNIFKCVCKDDYEEPDCRLVKETCLARGDPHYSTFDGTRYDFMGKCEYVLAKDSRNNTFEVRQVNEPCGNGEPSCTKSLTVIFPNVTIQLLRGSVMVNGTDIVLPATYGGVTITEPSNRVTLIESDYGVEVEWNNVRNVRVTVLGRYLNRTSGLCGTFNGNPGDDFLARNGTTVHNAVTFGNSWKTEPDCDDATDVEHACLTYSDRNATAIANCSALSSSPFHVCTNQINPDSEGYITDCEYDVCACGDDPIVCLCQALEAYVRDCNSTGVDIDWLSDPRYQQC